MTNLRIDSALLTALFASSMADWISARNCSIVDDVGELGVGGPAGALQPAGQGFRVDGHERAR